MKKYILSIIFALSCAFVSAASLRDYVCLVEPQVPEKTKEFLTEYKESLKSRGYNDYAEYIDSYLEGSFGSGFVVYGSDRKPYIITNRHVVIEAETVNITFDLGDGNTTKYEGLKTISSDEKMDFALIELPQDFKKPGLEFYTGSVAEGDEVWSAGFPGLGTKPLWQLGKGIVSNTSVKIEELFDPEISALIQHSAQIDGGNSGGPLLVKDSKSASGYKVIGINTWKAIYRENTNFSIASSVVKSFIDNAVKNKGVSPDFGKRLEEFRKVVSDKETTISEFKRFISNEFIAVYGKDAFIWVLNNCSDDTREAVASIFAYDPIDGMRYSIAIQVFRKFWLSRYEKDPRYMTNVDYLLERNDQEYSTEYTTSDPELEDNNYKVTFTYKGFSSYDSVWCEEQGCWKLKDFNGMAATAGTATLKKQKKVPHSGSITFSIKDFGQMNGINFNTEILIGANYCTFGGFSTFEQLKNSETIPFTMTGGVMLRFQVPVKGRNFFLVPYVDGRFGLKINTDFHAEPFLPVYGVGVGCNVIFENGFPGTTIAPVLGCGVVILKNNEETDKAFYLNFGITF